LDYIVKVLLEALLAEDELSIRAVLTAMKSEYNLEKLDNETYTQLQSYLVKAKEDSTKALLIETLVEGPESIELITLVDSYLDQYVKLISLGATNIEEAVRCLGAFSANDCSNQQIFTKVVEVLNKEFAVELLSHMGYKEWGTIPKHLLSIASEIEMARKIRYRSFIIASFLLITHPMCARYAPISSIAFSYPYVEAAINDWAWITPENTTYIIEEGIVTSKEAEVLVRLGEKIFHGEKLNSLDAKALYTDFFQGKDIFDVMYTLPILST